MTVIVKGIETRDADGKPYLRQDIDKWYAEQVKGDRIQLTLFVEALALIQKRPLDDLMSYFRLAAIHSAPWCEWDDVDQPSDPEDPNRIRGYCVHNNYTFPTWHRVYLMLYERALYDAMYEWVCKNVPDYLQDTWKKEADKWRLPYWDFARIADRPPSTGYPNNNNSDIDDDMLRLPILCMMPNVPINVFPEVDNGPIIKSRPNPLYKYVTTERMGEFPSPYTIPREDGSGFTYPWDKCYATTKYGILDGFDESIWADGGQNWLRSNYALNEHPYYGDKDNSPNGENPVPTLQDLVYRLFEYGLSSWGAFSSTRFPSEHRTPPPEAKPKSAGIEKYSPVLDNNVKNAINLEFIHNNLHNFVGGNQYLRPPKEGIHLWGAGHMSSVYMAAFDPIFFIYHNNIDRLTAMWQMLNWEKWFDDGYSQPTKDNKLTPFHKDADGNFWESDGVRNWRDLGYEYEILQGRDHGSVDDRNKILEDITRLYGRLTKDLFDKLPRDGDKEDADFVITVIYDKYALNGASYKINLFLDCADNYRGPESKGFVASIYNFSGSLDSGPCGNCQQQKADGIKCIAQVPVTAPMRHYLKSINKGAETEPEYLQPVYLALNDLGNPVKLDIHVELHRCKRPYYRHPFRPDPNDPLEYEHLKRGRQADEVFDQTSSS